MLKYLMELLPLEKYREETMIPVIRKNIFWDCSRAEIVRKPSFFELFWGYSVSALPEGAC